MPFVIFMFVFVWGWKVYHDMRTVPDGALEIQVMAKKWDWRFLYKNGTEITSSVVDGQKQPSTLIVPVGRPVKLIMGSEKIVEASTDPTDRPVLHSFYVPAARIKQDVVPGRYTMLWFNLDHPGEYQVFCTEFCGAGHYSMQAKIKAVPEAEFDKWLIEQGEAGDLTPVQLGAKLYTKQACAGCHSINGTKVVGPTFKGLWGRQESLADGSKVEVDENYLRESILNPNAKIVAGFQPGQMPVFAGALKEDEISAIIEFIKTLK